MGKSMGTSMVSIGHSIVFPVDFPLNPWETWDPLRENMRQISPRLKSGASSHYACFLCFLSLLLPQTFRFKWIEYIEIENIQKAIFVGQDSDDRLRRESDYLLVDTNCRSFLEGTPGFFYVSKSVVVWESHETYHIIANMWDWYPPQMVVISMALDFPHDSPWMLLLKLLLSLSLFTVWWSSLSLLVLLLLLPLLCRFIY